MPGLGKQLGCFAPSSHGVFPPSGSFPFHAPWPGDAFGADKTARASRRTEAAAFLQKPALSACIIMDGPQPEDWDAASFWVITSAGPLVSLQPPPHPDLQRAAMQPEIP